MKMPEVGRWLFYPTFYRSKFPSLLGRVFFIFYFLLLFYPPVKLTFWQIVKVISFC